MNDLDEIAHKALEVFPELQYGTLSTSFAEYMKSHEYESGKDVGLSSRKIRKLLGR